MTEEQPAPYGGGQSAPVAEKRKRVRIPHLREMKERGEKWAMLTSYDMYTAAIEAMLGMSKIEIAGLEAAADAAAPARSA